MKLTANQIEIPPPKVWDYLLKEREKNDKSKFLKSLGYSKENWIELKEDIKNIALTNNIILEKRSEFGDLYSIKGTLKAKAIVTIWFQQIGIDIYRFITLYPDNEKEV